MARRAPHELKLFKTGPNVGTVRMTAGQLAGRFVTKHTGFVRIALKRAGERVHPVVVASFAVLDVAVTAIAREGTIRVAAVVVSCVIGRPQIAILVAVLVAVPTISRQGAIGVATAVSTGITRRT